MAQYRVFLFKNLYDAGSGRQVREVGEMLRYGLCGVLIPLTPRPSSKSSNFTFVISFFPLDVLQLVNIVSSVSEKVEGLFGHFVMGG